MIIDALGRELWLEAPPQRIISLVPSLTEFLFAIGAGPRVVGATDYCTLPTDQERPRIGGTSNPDREALLALQPDLVLAARYETASGDISACEAAGIPVYITNVRSVSGAIDQLAALGRAIDAEDGASALLSELRAAQDRAYQMQSMRPMRRVVAFTWRDPWMAVGGDTYADDLLRLCGGENIALRLAGRNPRAGLDSFMRHNPQVVLLATDTYPFEEQDVNTFWPYGDVAAVAAHRVHLCAGGLFTRYGSRTVVAIRTVSQLIHDS